MAKVKKKSEPEHEDIDVSFSMLHFDPVNPRGEPESDEERIRAHFGSQHETYILAKHIANNGPNPLDRMAIIEHPKLPGHYVIREGNRRLCAMQLLRDPDRAPTESVRKRFQKLASQGNFIPETLPVVFFRDKEKARIWMSVKHEGEQNGLGTIEWGADEKARFNREGETGATRPKNPNRQAEALLTYAVDKGLITPEERKLISVTTITRYLPNTRETLALLNTEDCTTNATIGEFNKALQRFLKDALPSGTPGSNADVNSRSKSGERKAYAERLRRDGFSPINREQSPYDPAQTPSNNIGKKGQAKHRSAPHPGKRKQLIMNNFTVTIKDNILLRLVAEGKQLNPDDARFSCNYLNRVILERIVYLYTKKHGVGFNGEFSEVVQRVINHANKQPSPPKRNVVNILKKTADKKASFSYELMSNPIHGGSIPSGSDNRSNWETVQPALEYLLSQL